MTCPAGGKGEDTFDVTLRFLKSHLVQGALAFYLTVVGSNTEGCAYQNGEGKYCSSNSYKRMLVIGKCGHVPSEIFGRTFDCFKHLQGYKRLKI